MAHYKIVGHFMPWEIDFCMLSAIQFKKSKYYLGDEDKVTIEFVLNLSNALIDWDQSRIPKDFFKRKFENLAALLKDYTFTSKIYEGDEIYGHLDSSRESINKNVDYYINFCPDMYFSETLLKTIIDGSKLIKNKYFILTPEIYKLWDSTWDEITHSTYQNIPYQDWNKADIFDIRWNLKFNNNDIKLRPTVRTKHAGWFDCFNKAYFEELIPIHDDQRGYGPYDHYGMILGDYAKSIGKDFQQWVIENQVIFEYSVGPLKDQNFSNYYKEMLVMKNIPNQRKEFEDKMPFYLKRGVDKIITL